MPKFMLIVHYKPGRYDKMRPEQIQQIFREYGEWLEGLRSSGRYVVSDKLMNEGGKIATLETGQLNVVDGPYSETKEVVGGYFTIRAKDYEDALSVVQKSPFLKAGQIVVRQVDPMGCGDDE